MHETPSSYTTFQSTHPSGVRRECAGDVRADRAISIHAPQWGATRLRRFRPSALRFQSTHPSGVRRGMESMVSAMFKFQSTHPSGVRPAGRNRRRAEAYFNPRTPVGCDARDIPCRTLAFEFQSTHPSGVRREQDVQEGKLSQFQSTHPSGVRPRSGISMRCPC